MTNQKKKNRRKYRKWGNLNIY